MSSESKSKKTNSKESDSKKYERLKPVNSDATIKNEQMFANLEELMTYIGSSYPHFPKTVLPLLFVSSYLFLATRFLSGVDKMRALENPNQEAKFEFFYTKCHQNAHDNSMEVAKNGDFIDVKVPKWELTIVMNVIVLFSATTVSPRHIALCSLAIISLSYFVMARVRSQLQVCMYVAQVCTEVFRIVSMVTIAESVPKFHRMPALVLLEFSATAARGIATVVGRLPADLPFKMTYCFEVFGFATICMIFVVYYTYHDSLYSLLARSKTAEMQNRLDEILRVSQIDLAADAVIDQIAFENFENNENAIEILKKSLKTRKLVEEVLICGLISGFCLAINAFFEAEVNKHSEIFFFEKALVPLVSYSVSGILLIIFSILMPKKRILPVILIVPVLFFATMAVNFIPQFYKNYNQCYNHWVVDDSVFPFYMAIGVFMSALSDMIRFFVKVHLIEVMPVLIRAPILSLLSFVQYSFDGNVRDFYSVSSIGGFEVLLLISILPMLVLLITPRKKNDMNVYFLEYTKDDKKKLIPPAPQFVQ